MYKIPFILTQKFANVTPFRNFKQIFETLFSTQLKITLVRVVVVVLLNIKITQ